MKYIIAIGIFQALVAIFMLHKNKLRSGADGILIFLLACIATHFLIKFVIFNFVIDTQVRLQLNTFLGFCYGPLLYLYTQKLRNPSFEAGKKWFIFIPFILAMIGYFSVISVLIVASKAGYTMLKWYNLLTFLLLTPTEILYVFLSLSIAKEINNVHVREKKLVRQIAFAFLVMSIIGITTFFANKGVEFNILVRTICYSILLMLCVLIIRYRFMMLQYGQYQTMQQPSGDNIITAPLIIPSMPETVLTNVDAEQPEIKKSILSNEEQQRVWLELEQHMKTTKVFADGTLNLDRLATSTGINKYHISETLNDYAQTSFYQYINEYRIRFAIEQMKYLTEKDINVNILSLAYDSGFNAKSSFNRYFKEMTHQTPSEYLRSLQVAPINGNYPNGALG